MKTDQAFLELQVSVKPPLAVLFWSQLKYVNITHMYIYKQKKNLILSYSSPDRPMGSS